MRICIAVQARMKSERFPGKVLADLHGYPMLWSVFNRAARARLADDLVIAAAPDQELLEFGHTYDFPVVAGPETDLIRRYQNVLNETKCDAVVIVTGDCPLIDPEVIDLVISTCRAQFWELDYVTTSPPYTWPAGQDVALVPAWTLDRLDDMVPPGPDREWMTTYLWQHQLLYRTLAIARRRGLSYLRWMVDYPEDLDFVRKVYRRFGADCATATLVKNLPTNPWLTGVPLTVERHHNYVPEEYSI